MRVLIVDDFEDMRDLLEFVFARELGFNATLASSGQEAIAILDRDPQFDLIVSDLHMPHGTGQDLFNYCQNHKSKAPFILMSGDPEDKYPQLHGADLHWLKKPFEIAQLGFLVKKVMSGASAATDSYVPVSFALLQRMQNIEFPLFLRINEQKYVKLTTGPAVFDKIDLEKYAIRGLRYLYVESHYADEFIASYRKKVLSLDAWRTATGTDAELVSINTELLQNLSLRLGWGTHVIELAKQALQKALVLAKTNPNLTHVFNQFHQIERYGFSDHCTLTLLISCNVLRSLGYNDDLTLAKMTFASILHDMTLTEDLYENKSKLIKRIQKGDKRNHDMQVVYEHPAKAAELSRSWDFCPLGVDEIIMHHHEKPDGRGFPIGRSSGEIDFMSSVFIVAEDFADFFLEFYGAPDLHNYFESRRDYFKNGHFRAIFRCLEQSSASNKAA